MTKLQKIIGLVLVIIGIGLFAHDRYLQYKLENLPPSSTNIPVSTIVKSMTTYTDSAGRKHVVIPAKSNVIPEAKAKLKGTIGILDTASQALDIAARKIDQVTKANLVLAQQNIQLKAERDSLKKKTTYIYRDKFLSLQATKLDTSANLTATYSINTDLNWVDYSKRAWLLGTKRQYTDIFSSNPNITVRGVNRVTIEHPVTQFGLRLKVSTRYNFINNSINFGPGAEISINRFDVAGFYYYGTPVNGVGSWKPVINVDYNFLQF